MAAVLAVCLVAAGCAGRPGPETLNTTGRAVGAEVVRVSAITTRGPTSPPSNSYASGRSERPNYATYEVSVPPMRRTGEIKWPRPGRAVDASTDFAVVNRGLRSPAAFFEEVGAQAESRRGVALFVHGFNISFPEALYRTAQLSVDSGADDLPLVFAWPSLERVANYLGDRDAAAFSRDALAETLAALSEDRRIGEILVLGHSMGGWLTMEALRQLRLTGRDDVLSRLNVVLAAPDIDIDLFERQLAVLGPLDPPLTVLAAPDDVALRVSNRLGGARERAGELDASDPKVRELAQRRGVAIVDISQVHSPDRLNHSRFAQLAAMAGTMERSGTDTFAADMRQAGGFVFEAVGTTLSSPFTLIGSAIAGDGG